MQIVCPDLGVSQKTVITVCEPSDDLESFLFQRFTVCKGGTHIVSIIVSLNCVQSLLQSSDGSTLNWVAFCIQARGEKYRAAETQIETPLYFFSFEIILHLFFSKFNFINWDNQKHSQQLWLEEVLLLSFLFFSLLPHTVTV